MFAEITSEIPSCDACQKRRGLLCAKHSKKTTLMAKQFFKDLFEKKQAEITCDDMCSAQIKLDIDNINRKSAAHNPLKPLRIGPFIIVKNVDSIDEHNAVIICEHGFPLMNVLLCQPRHAKGFSLITLENMIARYNDDGKECHCGNIETYLFACKYCRRRNSDKVGLITAEKEEQKLTDNEEKIFAQFKEHCEKQQFTSIDDFMKKWGDYYVNVFYESNIHYGDIIYVVGLIKIETKIVLPKLLYVLCDRKMKKPIQTFVNKHDAHIAIYM